MAKVGRTAVVYDRGAATPLQIVDAAQEHGELVFVCDGASPHTDDALPLLRELADTIVVPDPAEAVSILRRSGIDGAVTFSDRTLPLCTEITEALGLRGHDRATAFALTDKLEQRTRLRDAGVPTPRFQAPDNPGGMADAVAEIGGACVVKPRRSCEGRHTYPVTGPDDLAVLLPSIARVWPDVNGFMVEERLIGDPGVAGEQWGDYVSVESVTVGGVARHVAVLGKLPQRPPFREAGHFFPSTLREAERDAVLDTTGRALAGVGVHDGVSHTEVKLTPDGPRVIEVNGRLGFPVDAVIESATGVSLLRVALAVATGAVDRVPSLLDRIVPGDKIGYQASVYAPDSTKDGSLVRRVGGVDELHELPGVLAVIPTKKRGDRLLMSEGMAGDLVKVYGTAGSHDELRSIFDWVNGSVTVQARP
jgi:biotin carboxylase